MKKVIIAAAIVAVAALTTLSVSSKTTAAKHTEVNKTNKTELASAGFNSQKNDISSAD